MLEHNTFFMLTWSSLQESKARPISVFMLTLTDAHFKVNLYLVITY